MSYKYMDELVTKLEERGFEVVRTTPELSLYMFVSRYVDAAVVSFVASEALSLRPCFACPAVVSEGKVENVVLVIKRTRDEVKLWVTPRSYTGRALALWYLHGLGKKVVCVGSPERADALLLIGDEARKYKEDGVDLGEAWYEETGLPMIYAVTVSNKEFQVRERYVWRRIKIVPLEEVLDVYLSVSKALRDYWVRPHLPSRGLLGLLLRSLK